jgi:hypothetical protein
MHIETDGRTIKIESFEYGLTYLGLEDDFSGKELNELGLDCASYIMGHSSSC